MPKLTTLGLSGPGAFSKEAIENAVRDLPENQIDLSATSADLKSADVSVSVQKTIPGKGWRGGWGFGWWGKVRVEDGEKPTGATGFEVKKKL